MAKVKQLTISLENQPGRLADVAQALSDARVNIVAFLGSIAERDCPRPRVVVRGSDSVASLLFVPSEG